MNRLKETMLISALCLKSITVIFPETNPYCYSLSKHISRAYPFKVKDVHIVHNKDSKCKCKASTALQAACNDKSNSDLEQTNIFVNTHELTRIQERS